MKTRLAAAGRLTLWFEPRDWWVGGYSADDAIYICIVPFLALRWARKGEW
ncbi:hypothetical protein [Sphaerisporangium aureirubrum]|uniref:Uncharacterized protein n=1 Tax=Sphaerisporangium aureirubrum TaxID=1544736 RepID=A0ABW1NDQ7_9ACTN